MKILTYLVSLLIILVVSTETFAEIPVVYSRCDRTTDSVNYEDTVPIGGVPTVVSRTFSSFDILDKLPDVTNFFDSFNVPCDLVYRDSEGVETVIYDCATTSTPSATCAALDANVSWDAQKIVFSVFRGQIRTYSAPMENRVLENTADSGVIPGDWKDYPNKFLDPQQDRGAQLYYYDFGTDSVTEITPYAVHRWDSGPVFIGTNRVAFTSTLDNNRSPKMYKRGSTAKGTRIYSIDLDGNNLRLDSHHSTSQEQHPIMMTNGELAYSSWQIFAGLPFRHSNGDPGHVGTDANRFMIYKQRPDGSRNFPIFGQHCCDHIAAYFGENTVASHFLGQMSDGKVCHSDYYRGNNNGAGAILCYPLPADGQEGDFTDHVNLFVQSGVINVATWSNNGDGFAPEIISPPITTPQYTDQHVHAGKLSHPSGIPSNQLLVTWFQGACNNATGNTNGYTVLGLTPPNYATGSDAWALVNNIESYNMDKPGCDGGIYRTTAIPVAHPNDLVKIVDSKDYHEIMARPVLPYSEIYGVSAPLIIPDSSVRTTHAELPKGYPFGLLGAASIIDRETHPIEGLRYQGTFYNDFEQQFNLQGTDTIDYTDDDLCGIRIIGIAPNRGNNALSYEDPSQRFISADQIQTIMGERAYILGEVPVKHYDGLGERIMNSVPEPDTSFLVKIPADVPHQLQAIDCDGHVLNTDQTWQSLRPGEVKTCGGCHVHSRAEELNFSESYAATGSYTIPQLGKGVVPLLAGKTGTTTNITNITNSYGIQYTFDDDIIPILNSRCVSCHSGVTPAGMLDLDTTGEDHLNTSTTDCVVWFKLFGDTGQACVDASKKVFLNSTDQYNLRRPNLTIHNVAFNPLRSKFYWKAVGQRMDGKTDGEDADDPILFGAAHPTDLTYEEAGIIQRWLTLGGPAGPQQNRDTQKPTLQLGVDLNVSNEITDIKVGTVDLGDGIDINSLVVCLKSGETCGSNLASTADPHGVVSISLGSPISDTSQVIRAEISDLATPVNTTVAEFTAGFLINNAIITPVTVHAGSNTTINVGHTFNRTIVFTDGEDTDSDGWTYDIDWCGSPESGSISAGTFTFDISRLFSSAQSCEVVITVTDAGEELSSDSFIITVDNSETSLVVDAGGDEVIFEGVEFSRSISIIDGQDEGSDGWTYTIDWDIYGEDTGSISPGSSSLLISNTFPDAPREGITIPVTVTIVDSVEDTSISTFDIFLLNKNPVATITGNNSGTVGVEYTISLDIVDSGDDTISSTTVFWGDGNSGSSLSHTYEEPCECIISVFVIDEDSIYRVGRKRVSIINP